jgi:hypothetical protein
MSRATGLVTLGPYPPMDRSRQFRNINRSSLKYSFIMIIVGILDEKKCKYIL